ncbi:MAG: hypothetical protein KIT11_09930 [Fimbriimonadaceae bacterium]|nr:hypothetical protein [Fimbriimonadaceae bacterium]QYK55643.1 MAG: hypothetical protein KF733_11600 [Fimbriimonadaceae bacterium]
MAAAVLERQGAVEGLGLVAPPDIRIECAGFTGSLGTLFRLVRDHRVDLLGVPMAPVCSAYLSYLLESHELDLDEAGVALAALAYLLERKSWALIPAAAAPEEPGDEAELPDPWVSEFKPVISALGALAGERELVFFRTPDDSPYELPFDPCGVQLTDLARALERLLSRAAPDPPDAFRKPVRSLSDQIVVVLRALGPDPRPLDALVVGDFTRAEVVWWFLALLELIRLGQARVTLGEDGEPCFARDARVSESASGQPHLA